MLRITETDVTVDGTKLRLDGKLVGPWVREMRLVCDPILAKGQQIQIAIAAAFLRSIATG